MNELLEDETIIIRPSDKGSGIVVMDTNEYTNTNTNTLLAQTHQQ